MAYATPDDLLTWYGADELAGLVQPDDLATLPAALLRATLAGDDRSAWSAEEQEAADLGVIRFENAIDHAGRLMDSYLGERYGLPLDTAVVAESPLPRLCGAIARHALWDDQPAEEVTRGFEQAMSWLREVAVGKAGLGAGGVASSGAGMPQSSIGRRVF